MKLGKTIPKYKYIGETARIAYKRGLEHERDFIKIRLNNHMLKHFLFQFEMNICKAVRSEF